MEKLVVAITEVEGLADALAMARKKVCFVPKSVLCIRDVAGLLSSNSI